MKRTRRQHTVLFTLCFLTVPVVGCALWLRAQQRQYGINRQLISSLVWGDQKRAMAGGKLETPLMRTTLQPVRLFAEHVMSFFQVETIHDAWGLFHRIGSLIMKFTTAITATATVLILSSHVMGYRHLPQQRQSIAGRSGKGDTIRHDPHMSVPTIARFLGVRVGYNGQDALTHQFGKGRRSVGGHPGGCKTWYTCHPSGYIETDGFDYNEEGLALESLSWALDPEKDPAYPVVRHLPRHAGWLGVIVPGMKMGQVSRLTAGRLPAPQKQGNTWTWKATGFVRPSPVNLDVYTIWTAELTFQKGVLDRIEVRID